MQRFEATTCEEARRSGSRWAYRVPGGASIGRWRADFARLARMRDDRLGALDIADLNLACAFGLPGAEGIDPRACLRKLDAWADLVRRSTQRWWQKFQNSPADYGDSPGQFRMLALVTVLQRDLGVRYNLAFSQGEYDARDSRDLFLHGLLEGHGGTCVTMPVLYIAIGRRLGYPLRLVQAKEHLFARWVEPGGEHFNVECTSLGFVTHPDEYYHHRPKPLSAADLRSGQFLRNLCPREELAVFLKERGCCLRDNLQMNRALEAFSLSARFAPHLPGIVHDLAVTTVLRDRFENACRQARQRGHSAVDLRGIPLPPATEHWHRWAIPEAHDCLQRIIENLSRRASDAARSRSPTSLRVEPTRRHPVRHGKEEFDV